MSQPHPARSLRAPTLLVPVWIALAAVLSACSAATPAARWDDNERMRIAQAFPNCAFFEDADRQVAGYACDLGSFRAHTLGEGEDHARATQRLAREHAEIPFTSPLAQVVEREPLTVGAETFNAALAAYEPKPETITQPEVMLILTQPKGGQRRAYTCSVVLMAGLDGEASIASRIASCVEGLGMLVEASK